MPDNICRSLHLSELLGLLFKFMVYSSYYSVKFPTGKCNPLTIFCLLNLTKINSSLHKKKKDNVCLPGFPGRFLFFFDVVVMTVEVSALF